LGISVEEIEAFEAILLYMLINPVKKQLFSLTQPK
jgi:hypothetical protein